MGKEVEGGGGRGGEVEEGGGRGREGSREVLFHSLCVSLHLLPLPPPSHPSAALPPQMWSLVDSEQLLSPKLTAATSQESEVNYHWQLHRTICSLLLFPSLPHSQACVGECGRENLDI